MKEKDFDAQVKNALDRLEAPYDPSSWAALQRRLDAPFAEENPAPVDPVDKAVYHKLQQLEAPYQPEHWTLLSGRLTELRRMRRRLWAAKASELAILLLLLVNLRGYWAEKPAPPPAKPRYQGPVALRPDAPANGNYSPNRVAGQTPGADVYPVGSTTGSAPFGVAIPVFLTENPADILSALPVFPFDLPAESGVSPAALAAAQPLPLVYSPFCRNGENPTLSPHLNIIVPAPRSNRFYFAAYAAADRNRVRVEGDLQKNRGFSTGFAVGYRRGKWGVETGVAYAQKQYVPKKKVEIYSGDVSNGYFGSYLGVVEADLMALPLKVTRRVGQLGRTAVYAAAGVTANVATHKTYRYKTIRYPGSAPSSQGNALAAEPQLRENGRGVLEKGRLADNAFVTADLGLRLERPIGGRWTAFVEPAFHQSLSAKGLGPNPAKINTFSVQAGVMASL